MRVAKRWVRQWSRRIGQSVRMRGVFGTCLNAGRAAGNRLGRLIRRNPQRMRDLQEDEAFDREFGVDTGGVIPASQLDIEHDNWKHASAYIATSPIDFGELLGNLGIHYEESVFIDCGCGKGRVVLMAAALPFKEVVGIEFSSELSSIARDNLERYRGPRSCAKVSIVTMDVVDFRFPEVPLVMFLYHPFDDAVMTQVVEHLGKSCETHPRRMVVLYFKPVHANVWEQAPFVTKTASNGLYDIYDTDPGCGTESPAAVTL